MRPDFTGMQKVLDRIDEIAQKCNPQIERPDRSQSVQNRFVEILEGEKKNNEEKKEVKRSAAASVDDLRRQVSRVADEYNIDEELIRAVIQVESGWKRDAVSVKGAMGLMQLMPRTATMLGVDDAFDPE